MTSPTRDWHGLTIPQPGLYLLDDAHKRVGFVAQHMMVSPVRGEFARASASIRVAADPLMTQVSATVHTASIDTSNADRDVHLRSADFMETDRYPTMEFRSTSLTWQDNNDPIFQWARLRNNPLSRRNLTATLPAAATQSAGSFTLIGDMTIKGVCRSVTMALQFGGAGRDPYGRDIFGFSATADINREDFGMRWNVPLDAGGWLIGKQIRIEIGGEAIHQQPQ